VTSTESRRLGSATLKAFVVQAANTDVVIAIVYYKRTPQKAIVDPDIHERIWEGRDSERRTSGEPRLIHNLKFCHMG